MKKTTRSLTSFQEFKLENPKAIFGGLADENNNNGNGDNGGGTDPIKTSTAGGGMHNSNDRP